MAERRGTRRYALSLPIVAWGPRQTRIEGMTRDISNGGVYLRVDHPLPETAELEFLMALPRTNTAGDVFIRATGKAVRVEHKQQGEAGGVGIAAHIETCDVVRGSDLNLWRPYSLPCDGYSVPFHPSPAPNQHKAVSREDR